MSVTGEETVTISGALVMTHDTGIVPGYKQISDNKFCLDKRRWCTLPEAMPELFMGLNWRELEVVDFPVMVGEVLAFSV